MFRVVYGHPQLAAWQARLARMPRWAWAAIGIGIVVPVVLLLLAVVLVGLFFGLVVLGGVAVLLTLRGLVLRLTGRTSRGIIRAPGQAQDGRRNVRVVDVQVRRAEDFV